MLNISINIPVLPAGRQAYRTGKERAGKRGFHRLCASSFFILHSTFFISFAHISVLPTPVRPLGGPRVSVFAFGEDRTGRQA
jgi:hypothetical protein